MMRRLALACLILAVPVAAQITHPPTTTEVNLPTCAALYDGQLRTVTNATSQACNPGGAGGGTERVLCLCDASVPEWVVKGSGGSSFTPSSGISTDHGAGAVSSLTDLGDLCDGNEIIERNAGDSAWACIATPSGGGGSGDITDVGDCATGACFQSESARTVLAAPAVGGVATFRLLTEADISDLGAYIYGSSVADQTITQNGRVVLSLKDDSSPTSGAITAWRDATDTQLHVSCQATQSDNCFEVDADGDGSLADGGFALQPDGDGVLYRDLYLARNGVNAPGAIYFTGGGNNVVFGKLSGSSLSQYTFWRDTTTGDEIWRYNSSIPEVFSGVHLRINDGLNVLSGDVDVNSGTLTLPDADSLIFGALGTTPASSSETCTTGEFRIDANYIYVCTATNTWRRATLAAF